MQVETAWPCVSPHLRYTWGRASGSVLGHTLQLGAERYTPSGANKIPDGRVVNVGGTPFDFREAKAIGRDLTGNLNNYDHNYVLGGGGLKHTATLTGDASGISMDLMCDFPCLQLYTAQEMELEANKDGAAYTAYAGVALETQYAPDAVHHPIFVQPYFSPEEPFHHRSVYRFRW